MCDEYYWFLWQILFYHWHRKCDIFDKQGGEADQLPGPGMRVSQGHPWDNHWIISHGLCEKRQASHFPPIWVWVNTYRYIFSGMNIHLPAILGFTRYQGFDPSPFEKPWCCQVPCDLHYLLIRFFVLNYLRQPPKVGESKATWWYEYPNYRTFTFMLIISKKSSIALSTCSNHWKAAHPAVKNLMTEADTDGLQPLHIAAAGG